MPRINEPCMYHLRGRHGCARGDKCWYRHGTPCFKYIAGTCLNGNKCQYVHIPLCTKPRTCTDKCAFYHPKKHCEEYARTNECFDEQCTNVHLPACRDFPKGKCFGACLYPHVIPDERNSSYEESSSGNNDNEEFYKPNYDDFEYKEPDDYSEYKEHEDYYDDSEEHEDYYDGERSTRPPSPLSGVFSQKDIDVDNLRMIAETLGFSRNLEKSRKKVLLVFHPDKFNSLAGEIKAKLEDAGIRGKDDFNEAFQKIYHAFEKLQTS